MTVRALHFVQARGLGFNQKFFTSQKAHRLGLQDRWCRRQLNQLKLTARGAPLVVKVVGPRASSVPFSSVDLLKVAEVALNVATSSFTRVGLQRFSLLLKCGPPVSLLIFSLWGLDPMMRFLHRIIRKEDSKWVTSRTQHFTASYIRPVVIWFSIIWICRTVDPLVLSTAASNAIKDRFVNFVRSLSTVLAFAYCAASLTQQIQKMMMERPENQDNRSLGVSFIGNAVYTSVWVAAVCLFMELLGFSTQKWITAGGLGTVLLTLAGREIFTNFLSSIILHLTRPFVENEWIQTKIEGQEVSGTVEHVGWWSPTVIRGDDREAVHIPNHKFTVSVVRNLSQKTHWRIKTHVGISHLDAAKIPNIVADMRKVLSKHPQVEQQRLHRRAFFDTVDPVNQALLILISCFVKTSHFEEYLRVKEIILLDLLRVISHHNARLATPIRSVQRILDEGEARQSPFRDVRGSDESRRRPIMLIEATNSRAHETEEEGQKQSGTSGDISKEVSSKNSCKVLDSTDGVEIKISTKKRGRAVGVERSSGKAVSPGMPEDALTSSSKSTPESHVCMPLKASNVPLLKGAHESASVIFSEDHVHTPVNEAATVSNVTGNCSVRPSDEQKLLDSAVPVLASTEARKGAPLGSARKASDEDDEDPWKEPALAFQHSMSGPKLEGNGGVAPGGLQKSEASNRAVDEKSQPSVLRVSSVEENLVLEVALDRPKRTLPLDDVLTKQMDLVVSMNGVGGSLPSKDRQESPVSQPSSCSAGGTHDGSDWER